MLNPVGSRINVVRAYDAQLDSWRGAALLAENHFKSQAGIEQFCLTKAMYDECGHHYLKEHMCSNYLYGASQTEKTQFVYEQAAAGRRV
jgi:actin-related protein